MLRTTSPEAGPAANAALLTGPSAEVRRIYEETIALTQGKPVRSMGYTLTYTGYRAIDKERYAFQVNVERGGQRYTVAPIMYYTSYNDGLMRTPDIANLSTRDFYLAPLSLEQKNDSVAGMQNVELKRGETKMIGTLRVTFVDFDFPVMQKAAMLEGKEVRIGARLLVREGSNKEESVTPAKVINAGKQRDDPVRLGDSFEITIAGMHPDREARENSRVTTTPIGGSTWATTTIPRAGITGPGISASSCPGAGSRPATTSSGSVGFWLCPVGRIRSTGPNGCTCNLH
jgi:hypothetical protein